MNDRLTISLFELFEKFPDEESAKKYLEGKRWSDKVVCPFCGKSEKQWRMFWYGLFGEISFPGVLRGGHGCFTR